MSFEFSLKFIRQKILSFVELLGIIRSRVIAARALFSIKIDLKLDYQCCNPSFFLYKNEIRGIVRTVNYIKENSTASTDFTSGSQWDTINCYVKISESGEYSLLNRISDEEYRKVGLSENGLEDLRVFTHQEKYYVIGSLASSAPRPSCTIFIAELDPVRGALSGINVIPSPVGSVKEKNWMPFQRGNDLFVIYDFSPLTIYQINTTGGTFSLGEKTVIPTPVSVRTKYSGGSNLIKYKAGFLGLIHRRTVIMGNTYYKHAFLYVSYDLDRYEISKEFFFRSKGIEFAVSLFEKDDNLFIGYSETDRMAWLDCYAADVIPLLGLNV